MTPVITPAEARVLFTALAQAYLPSVGLDEAQSAIKKLCVIGGGYRCKDCTDLGTRPARGGGFVCEAHHHSTQEKTQ